MKVKHFRYSRTWQTGKLENPGVGDASRIINGQINKLQGKVTFGELFCNCFAICRQNFSFSRRKITSKCMSTARRRLRLQLELRENARYISRRVSLRRHSIRVAIIRKIGLAKSKRFVTEVIVVFELCQWHNAARDYQRNTIIIPDDAASVLSTLTAFAGSAWSLMNFHESLHIVFRNDNDGNIDRNNGS